MLKGLRDWLKGKSVKEAVVFEIPIITGLTDWSRKIHAWAHEKGFYRGACRHALAIGPQPPYRCDHVGGSRAVQLMLTTTELTEANHAYRNGDQANWREELADTLIRLLDMICAEGWDADDLLRCTAQDFHLHPDIVSDSVSAALLRVVSDLAEACEADRKGDQAAYREAIGLALMETLVFMVVEKIDIQAEVEKKMTVNMNRPHLHGKAY